MSNQKREPIDNFKPINARSFRLHTPTHTHTRRLIYLSPAHPGIHVNENESPSCKIYQIAFAEALEGVSEREAGNIYCPIHVAFPTTVI